MKGKFRIALAAGVAAVSLIATAGAASYDHCADQLKDLGLFQGTAQGYELDRAPTRAEAATMLVRLLGKEAEAKELVYSAPFTDLDAWQQPYVQYLYDNGLTTGATATTFEPEEKCTAQMYTTFLLRALGYSDQADGGFTYAEAVSFGEEIGLVDYANCDEDNFLRDHVAAMSLTALHTPVVGDQDTVLLEKLVSDGAVAEADAKELLAFFDRFDSYAKASEQMSGATKMDMTANIAATVSMGETQVMTMDMPMRMKTDMNLEQMDKSKIEMTGKVNLEMNEAMVGDETLSKIEQDVTYYYADGVYYMNLGGQKIKMDMSFDDMLSQMGNLSVMQKTEPLCLIDSIEQTGNTVTVSYSASGMNAMVDSVLQSMGMPMPADESFKMDQVTAKVTVENGTVKGMDISMRLTMNVEGQTMTVDMTMDCTVNRMGSGVTITLPNDLNTYEDLLGGADAPAA